MNNIQCTYLYILGMGTLHTVERISYGLHECITCQFKTYGLWLRQEIKGGMSGAKKNSGTVPVVGDSPRKM